MTLVPSSESSKIENLYVLRRTSWVIEFNLIHISGNYFMCHLDSAKAPGTLFKQAIPGEFIVGADGVVQKFGIAAEPEMGKEGRIWFERVF
jgi:hypothetical protein